jgi:AcrR family transcriptional regulator
MKNRRPGKLSRQKTREQLLRAASNLFAEYGYKSVSIRQIADAAGVNSALIGYHFGGKQGLFAEAYRSYAAPINAERMRRLDKIQADGEPQLTDVLDAWIRPSVQTGGKYRPQHIFLRLITVRTRQNAAYLDRLAYETYGPINEAFLRVLATCLPHLTWETLVWRFFFLIGSLLEPRLPGLKGTMHKKDVGDTETMLSQIKPFVVQGFMAPDPIVEVSSRAPKRKLPAAAE